MFETGVAEALAAGLLTEADARRGRAERARAARVNRLLGTQAGRNLILALTDEVLRIRDPQRAAAVLRGLAADGAGRATLGPLDRLPFAVGAGLAPPLPGPVIPAVRERVRSEMAGVILPAGHRHL